MRLKYKSPRGTGLIEVDDDATLGTVYGILQAKTGIGTFSLKVGPPMAMKTIDLSQKSMPAKSLSLNRETITIVPEDPRSDAPLTTATMGTRPQEIVGHGPNRPAGDINEINTPWPERDGTLCRRTAQLYTRRATLLVD